MAHLVLDRVRQQAASGGTGAFTFVSTLVGFEAFSARLTADGDTTWYCATNGAAEWEIGLGTRTSATTMARTTVIESSNADAAVNFTSPPVVFSAVPGTKLTPLVFRMSRTSAQTLTSGVETTVTFNQVDLSVGGGLNAGAGTFTAPSAGAYDFSWCLGGSGANGSFFSSWLDVNGTPVAEGSQQVWSSGIAIYSVGRDVRALNANDVVKVRCYASGTGPSVSGSAGGHVTFFSGQRLLCGV